MEIRRDIELTVNDISVAAEPTTDSESAEKVLETPPSEGGARPRIQSPS